ncbi:MAG: usg protein [Proteobacteria bacterium]|nr:usg protein [Pseudomonadota bacterium]
MTDRVLEKQLKGWSLTTAEILYRLPDHRGILQTFLWQDYDIAPRFPRLIRFLDFWTHNLDGPLHSVRVAHAAIVGPHEMRHVNLEWRLH